MTAQINDVFLHHRREYAVAGISEGQLFDLALLGLEPRPNCTACWRGYQAVFALAGSRLVLDTLHINLEQAPGPLVNGVAPKPSTKRLDFFNNHYEKLDYHLEYTGGVLLGDGFISRLYVHMGFHPAWKYKRVIELIFDAGVLRAEYDRSARVAEIRKEMAALRDAAGDAPREPTRDEIKHFIDRAFDRSYRI